MEEKIMGILMQILEDVGDLKQDMRGVKTDISYLKEDNVRNKTRTKRAKRR